MKKKTYILLLLSISSIFTLRPCGEWDFYEYGYDGLILSQELINEPLYYPFLLDLYNRFYTSADSTTIVTNGNIAEWSKYLNVGYDDAYYLVFKSTEQDIQKLLKKEKTNNPQLQFANNTFLNRHTDALNYLLLAKKLEPFMRILGSTYDSWGVYEDQDPDTDVSNIPYTQTVAELQNNYKQAKDKELKLRYAYQLVRLAHYNKEYDEAVRFFDTYVEPLNYKPEMYYYALSQKAGALHGLGKIIESNNLFLEVFSHSQDLKKTAVTSIRFTQDVDFEQLLASAKTVDEQNDADLLLGFIDFNDPLASASKIIARSPDAIQAKVLVARAIAQLGFDNFGNFYKKEERRYPILNESSQKNIPNLLSFVQKQANSPDVKNKNYWNITLVYLFFVQKQFDQAQIYLDKVDQAEKGYDKQKAMLASFIDVAKTPTIDADAEKKIVDKYLSKNNLDGKETFISILANRYYLQKDYAKSFMLTCSLSELMDNPNLTLLNAIDDYYEAPHKTAMDQYICNNFRTGLDNQSVSVPQLAEYMRGMIYITEDKLEDAQKQFEKSTLSLDTVPDLIFGYNSIECFTCDDNMQVDYLDEFPYIEKKMDEKQLVGVLIKLKQDAHKGNAKANYLLGNFYYNTSLTGYYRNFLRFGYLGGYRQVFCDSNTKDDLLTTLLYFNTIPIYYDNTTSIADSYLKEAYKLASGNEFKARIVFALSKCEQEFNYQKLSNTLRYSWDRSANTDWVLITNRQYFKEMMKYKHTNFFKEVQSNCLYFDYYVNHL